MNCDRTEGSVACNHLELAWWRDRSSNPTCDLDFPSSLLLGRASFNWSLPHSGALMRLVDHYACVTQFHLGCSSSSRAGRSDRNAAGESRSPHHRPRQPNVLGISLERSSHYVLSSLRSMELATWAINSGSAIYINTVHDRTRYSRCFPLSFHTNSTVAVNLSIYYHGPTIGSYSWYVGLLETPQECV